MRKTKIKLLALALVLCLTAPCVAGLLPTPALAEEPTETNPPNIIFIISGDDSDSGNKNNGDNDGSGEKDAPENGVQDADQSITTVAGQVTWLSNVPEFEKVSVTIYLLRDDKEIASHVVTAGTDWNYSFENLPIRDNEHTFTYTIKVDSLGENYYPSVNGTDVRVVYSVPALEKYIQKDVHQDLPAFDTPFTYTISRAAGEVRVSVDQERVQVPTGSAIIVQDAGKFSVEPMTEDQQQTLDGLLARKSSGDIGVEDVWVLINSNGEEKLVRSLKEADALQTQGWSLIPHGQTVGGLFLNGESGTAFLTNSPADVFITGKACVNAVVIGSGAEDSTVTVGSNAAADKMVLAGDRSNVNIQHSAQVGSMVVAGKNSTVILEGGAQVDKLEVTGDNANVNIKGNAQVGSVTVNAPGATIQNDGTVGNLTTTENAADMKTAGNGTVNNTQQTDSTNGGSAASTQIIEHAHQIVTAGAVAVSCTQAGYTGDKVCSLCGETISKGTIIHPLDHDWGEWTQTIDPTCIEQGEETRACQREGCGKTEARVIDALGHDLIDHVAQAPTCTAIGWDAYQTCSRCDYTTYAEKAAKGHTLVEDAVVPATCTEPGKTAGSHCSVCSAVITAQETVPAKGHTPVDDAAVPATCTDPGKTAGSHCSVCNEVITAQETIPAKGHTPVDDAAVPATCTDPGKTAGSHCSVCNAVITAQETVPAKGHTPVEDAAVPATCTEPGKTAGSHCSVCNAVLVAQETISALGHTGGEATCLAKAICTRCNQPYGDLGAHKMEEVEPAMEPSCENPGMTAYYRCSVCEEAEIPSEEYGTPLGHDWGAWSQTKAPTCTGKGEESHTCKRSGCGATETRLVDELGHAWATIWTQGETTHYHACTRDDCIAKNDEAEHSYNEDHECSVCGAPEPVFVVGE